MRESIVPMHREKPGRSQDDPSPAHRCDEFQPGNPWRVALQQSSPPLPRPSSGSTINSRPPSESQRTAHRAFPNCLTQGVHPSFDRSSYASKRRIPEIHSLICGVFAPKIFFPLKSPPKHIVFSGHFLGQPTFGVFSPLSVQCEGGTTVATTGAPLGLVMASRTSARGALPENSTPPGEETIPSRLHSAGKSYWTGVSFHWA
jgi:hypothetical protein